MNIGTSPKEKRPTEALISVQRIALCLFLWPAYKSGWWFQMLFVFTPTWGNDPV